MWFQTMAPNNSGKNKSMKNSLKQISSLRNEKKKCHEQMITNKFTLFKWKRGGEYFVAIEVCQDGQSFVGCILMCKRNNETKKKNSTNSNQSARQPKIYQVKKLKNDLHCDGINKPVQNLAELNCNQNANMNIQWSYRNETQMKAITQKRRKTRKK